MMGKFGSYLTINDILLIKRKVVGIYLAVNSNWILAARSLIIISIMKQMCSLGADACCCSPCVVSCEISLLFCQPRIQNPIPGPFLSLAIFDALQRLIIPGISLNLISHIHNRPPASEPYQITCYNKPSLAFSHVYAPPLFPSDFTRRSRSTGRYVWETECSGLRFLLRSWSCRSIFPWPFNEKSPLLLIMIDTDVIGNLSRAFRPYRFHLIHFWHFGFHIGSLQKVSLN